LISSSSSFLFISSVSSVPVSALDVLLNLTVLDSLQREEGEDC
jgi:hypothetical protein